MTVLILVHVTISVSLRSSYLGGRWWLVLRMHFDNRIFLQGDVVSTHDRKIIRKARIHKMATFPETTCHPTPMTKESIHTRWLDLRELPSDRDKAGRRLSFSATSMLASMSSNVL